jgi:hypothetical protein
VTITSTYQSNEDAEQLNDVRVSNAVETSKQSVEDSYESTQHYAGSLV